MAHTVVWIIHRARLFCGFAFHIVTMTLHCIQHIVHILCIQHIVHILCIQHIVHILVNIARYRNSWHQAMNN